MRLYDVFYWCRKFARFDNSVYVTKYDDRRAKACRERQQSLMCRFVRANKIDWHMEIQGETDLVKITEDEFIYKGNPYEAPLYVWKECDTIVTRAWIETLREEKSRE